MQLEPLNRFDLERLYIPVNRNYCMEHVDMNLLLDSVLFYRKLRVMVTSRTPKHHWPFCGSLMPWLNHELCLIKLEDSHQVLACSSGQLSEPWESSSYIHWSRNTLPILKSLSKIFDAISSSWIVCILNSRVVPLHYSESKDQLCNRRSNGMPERHKFMKL